MNAKFFSIVLIDFTTPVIQNFIAKKDVSSHFKNKKLIYLKTIKIISGGLKQINKKTYLQTPIWENKGNLSYKSVQTKLRFALFVTEIQQYNTTCTYTSTDWNSKIVDSK